MKRKSLLKIASLTRSIDEYHDSIVYGIRRTRYFYIAFFSIIVIIVCLSYGNFVDIRRYWNIEGMEHMIVIFCFMHIAASIWILNFKKEWYSISDYINLNDTEAEKQIGELKKTEERILNSWARELAADLAMIISIVFLMILTFSKGDNLSELLNRAKKVQTESDWFFFTVASYLIAFIIGHFIGSPYSPVRFRKIQRKVERQTRNTFIDAIVISKINPTLNERTRKIIKGGSETTGQD